MKWICVLLSLTLLLCSCSDFGRREEPVSEVMAPGAGVYITNDPQKAVDEIYTAIDIEEIVPLNNAIMRDLLGFALDEIEEYYGRYSSGHYGLADVYILRPNEESYDSVRGQLEQVRYNRIAATENYDILGANQIAQDSRIFQYGSYLILLMLEDTERAEGIIEQYIPSTDLGE